MSVAVARPGGPTMAVDLDALGATCALNRFLRGTGALRATGMVMIGLTDSRRCDADASKHGSTAEIAQSIADGIRQGLGFPTAPPVADLEFVAPTVDVWSVEDAPEPGDFDAVVIGSALYMGRWLHSARTYIHEHANALAGVPVWLFSSGPIGEMGLSDEPPADVAELREDMRIEGDTVFGGKLERHSLHLAEKAVVVALRSPDGDYRDWPAVAEWSHGIAAALLAGARP